MGQPEQRGEIVIDRFANSPKPWSSVLPAPVCNLFTVIATDCSWSGWPAAPRLPPGSDIDPAVAGQVIPGRSLRSFRAAFAITVVIRPGSSGSATTVARRPGR